MVAKKMQIRMISPPMVGVPFFFRCVSGTSSRMLLWPSWAPRSRSISHGPITIPSNSALTPPATIRNEG